MMRIVPLFAAGLSLALSQVARADVPEGDSESTIVVLVVAGEDENNAIALRDALKEVF